MNTALFQHRLAPCLALFAAVALLSVGCGGGGDGTPSNVSPTLAFQSPNVDLEGQVGMVIDVRYVADDPDDEAMTDIYADLDGNIATIADRYTILKDRPEVNGGAQTVQWDTTGVPEGSYYLVGVVSDGDAPPVIQICPATIKVWNVYPHDHTNIVLRDYYGAAIQAGSTMPYSPRETCGACHDIDEISNGYHAQQGRTDEHGDIQTKDDFFEDGRTWLKSDGMYGKW